MTTYLLTNPDGAEATLTVDGARAIGDVGGVQVDFARGNPDFDTDKFLDHMRAEGHNVTEVTDLAVDEGDVT